MDVVTKILSASELEAAVALLQQNQVVAFPTETVYGLGANALEPAAVEKIFLAKGRPQDNPLIVHCASTEQVRDLVADIPQGAQALMEKFWPGPLTLVFEKTSLIPSVVSAGLNTVGIRIPDHPLALRLIEQAGFPLAAPSANISGKPSPTRAAHVLADLNGKIPAILDGGETGWGLESTVLDCTVEPFVLLRPGGVTLTELQSVTAVQGVETSAESSSAPRSPGMKYKHYAPQAELYVVLGEKATAEIQRRSAKYVESGSKVGVMTWAENAIHYPNLVFLSMGAKGELNELASRLYHLLREADRLQLKVLFIEGVEEEGLGLAIMNRLRKAAQDKIIET